MTIRSQQIKTQFIQLTHCGKLEEFCADHPEQTVQPILDFINGSEDANVLLIRSDIGNGGTHLLSGAANALLDRGEVILCMSSEMVLRHAVIMPEEIRRYIGNCSFVCIDYFDHLLNRPDPMKEVCSMLNLFLSEGGKIILQSSKSIDANGISRYLRARKLVQVTSEFPSFETLKKISLQHVNASVVEDLAESVFAKSENSVRVVLGQMIAEDARRKLKLLHDRKV